MEAFRSRKVAWDNSQAPSNTARGRNEKTANLARTWRKSQPCRREPAVEVFVQGRFQARAPFIVSQVFKAPQRFLSPRRLLYSHSAVIYQRRSMKSQEVLRISRRLKRGFEGGL